ncbi:hypothetical protein Misp05_26670 [Micromonospora sp. NBRC 107095]|nr:hypothetical protein Misp05_26670 [Micromonospora sp. NBRC 107095]
MVVTFPRMGWAALTCTSSGAGLRVSYPLDRTVFDTKTSATLTLRSSSSAADAEAGATVLREQAAAKAAAHRKDFEIGIRSAFIRGLLNGAA